MVKQMVFLLTAGLCAALAFQAKKPIDYVNALVGTAPLDDPKLIGNAPPPGEELYTGMTSPGAVLPHGVTNLGPVNKNLDLAYGAGVGMSYNYTHRTMLGFTSPMQGMMVMPVVGDWTVPPERSASYYSKDQEKAAAGYYTVYLDDYRVKVRPTAWIDEHSDHHRNLAPIDQIVHDVLGTQVSILILECLPVLEDHQSGRN